MREDIIRSIQTELDYQEALFQEDKHIRDGLETGEIILAIEKILLDARTVWYTDRPPHLETKEHLRKIAALCVRACSDEHGMPERITDLL